MSFLLSDLIVLQENLFRKTFRINKKIWQGYRNQVQYWQLYCFNDLLMCNKRPPNERLKTLFCSWVNPGRPRYGGFSICRGSSRLWPTVEAGISRGSLTCSLLWLMLVWADRAFLGLAVNRTASVAAWLPPPWRLAPSMGTPEKARVEASFPKARPQRLVQHQVHSFLLVKKSQTKGRWVSIPLVEAIS